MDGKEIKSHGAGEGKLVPTSLGQRALHSSPCTTIDWENTREPGQWHREGLGGQKKETIIKKGAALVHLAEKTKSEGRT